ncbi:MAG: YlmC/YmxH family sporulation protein [Ruminococcus sp.]|jgi:YlmC/YmxH family sporulation protein|nr:YlmC/YmxH family sporulation protein [Ruminococcus sp.]
MLINLKDLHKKEVINVRDGRKLGYVDDVEIDSKNASITSLIIYGQERWLGFFGREDDIQIEFSKIQLIGVDTILVDCAIYV